MEESKNDSILEQIQLLYVQRESVPRDDVKKYVEAVSKIQKEIDRLILSYIPTRVHQKHKVYHISRTKIPVRESNLPERIKKAIRKKDNNMEMERCMSNREGLVELCNMEAENNYMLKLMMCYHDEYFIIFIPDPEGYNKIYLTTNGYNGYSKDVRVMLKHYYTKNDENVDSVIWYKLKEEPITVNYE